MRDRYSGYLPRIALFAVIATAICLPFAEPIRFAAGWNLLSGGWLGATIFLSLGSLFLCLTLRVLGCWSKPCPACRGSGQGNWPAEDPAGNPIHVCPVCRNAAQDPRTRRRQWLSWLLFATLAGFCLAYGGMELMKLWRERQNGHATAADYFSLMS